TSDVRRSKAKRYSGDNRLIAPKSSHRRGGLAPRCRLIASWGWRRPQGYGCSPFKAVRELGSEQPYPWDLLQPQDAMSRHRGAKPPRRCELLGEISLLSPEYLLSFERRPFHSEIAGSLNPAFAPARPVCLAVKQPYAFTLYTRLPTALRVPLGASVTF